MSMAVGITPAHLINKGEACFAVVSMALDWRMNPQFVARHTYQTPSGAIGFDGALVQGILERSGKFLGAPEIEYRGDWESLTGKFRKATGQRGGEYVTPTWTDKDAIGLGVIVRWTVRGEQKPRVWPGETTPFWLTQCYPLNSPLWATDPKTQIAYLAIRRFANLASPGILGAASFDYEDITNASAYARDVTPPRPTLAEPSRTVTDVEDGTTTESTEKPVGEQAAPAGQSSTQVGEAPQGAAAAGGAGTLADTASGSTPAAGAETQDATSAASPPTPSATGERADLAQPRGGPARRAAVQNLFGSDE
jgi:hypothetical protein